MNLIYKIYPSISTILLIAQYLASRAILAIANIDVTRLNNLTLKMIRREWQLFKSVDKAVNLVDRETFPLEFFYQIYEPLLLPYILRLKVGMLVMLLRNLDPPRLCNGSRIQLRFISQKVLEGVIIERKYERQKALLSRILLQSKDNNERSPVLFTRRQFLIRLAFAMTINKSQGQSLKYVDLDLQIRSCFSYGQLYVAFSRVTHNSNLYIIGPNITEFNENHRIINVVWRQILLIQERCFLKIWSLPVI